MVAHKTKVVDALCSEMKRGYELNEAGDHDGAFEVARRVIERGKAAGITSPFVCWHAAIAADQGGNFEMAFDFITQALALDPLAQPFRNSFEIIVNRIRASLSAPERAVDDHSTPRLYELLVRSGEADVGAHVAMVRYLLAKRDTAKAARIADAVALLNPTDRDAWLCKAEVATAAGDEAAASTAIAEAASIAGEPVPFAIPGVAKA